MIGEAVVESQMCTGETTASAYIPITSLMQSQQSPDFN